jgi:hypothetical protein
MGTCSEPVPGGRLVQPFRTGTEQECALRVGFDPFTKPSAKDRSLRIAVANGVGCERSLSAQLCRPRTPPLCPLRDIQSLATTSAIRFATTDWPSFVVSRYRTGGGARRSLSSCRNTEATRTTAFSSINLLASAYRASKPLALSDLRTGRPSYRSASGTNSSASLIRSFGTAARGPIFAARSAEPEAKSSG